MQVRQVRAQRAPNPILAKPHGIFCYSLLVSLWLLPRSMARLGKRTHAQQSCVKMTVDALGSTYEFVLHGAQVVSQAASDRSCRSPLATGQLKIERHKFLAGCFRRTRCVRSGEHIDMRTLIGGSAVSEYVMCDDDDAAENRHHCHVPSCPPASSFVASDRRPSFAHWPVICLTLLEVDSE